MCTRLKEDINFSLSSSISVFLPLSMLTCVSVHVHECCGCAWFPSRHVHTPEANLSENTTEASHYGFSTLLLLFLFCFSSTKTCKTSSTSSPTVESLLSAPWCLVPVPALFYPQTVELILPVSWCLLLESMIIKKNSFGKSASSLLLLFL